MKLNSLIRSGLKVQFSFNCEIFFSVRMSTSVMLASAILFCGVLLMPGCKAVKELDKPLMVTEEAWFEVKVMNEKNETAWQGRFTIAVFGDVAPMTVMNFVAITRGYKRGQVGGKALSDIL